MSGFMDRTQILAQSRQASAGWKSFSDALSGLPRPATVSLGAKGAPRNDGWLRASPRLLMQGRQGARCTITTRIRDFASLREIDHVGQKSLHLSLIHISEPTRR